MANRKNWLGVLVIVLVFGMTVVGCDDGSGGETDPALNGTWVGNDEYGSSIELHCNNGSFEQIFNNRPYTKGTYTTSGDKVTIKVTHLHGDAFIMVVAESKWYTKAEAKTALKSNPVVWGETLTDAEIDELLNSYYNTRTSTYSVSGNTAILDGITYTKK